MSEAAVLKLLVIGQTGLFLLVVLVLWQHIDEVRQGLLRVRHHVGLRGNRLDTTETRGP